jgi:hypothetical protein
MMLRHILVGPLPAAVLFEIIKLSRPEGEKAASWPERNRPTRRNIIGKVVGKKRRMQEVRVGSLSNVVGECDGRSYNAV